MIRIRRWGESQCPELATERANELVRVRGRLAAGAELSARLLGTQYDVAKLTLYRMQHFKCCYCEAIQSTHKWRPVEHFRPKTEVLRGDETCPGYWWLTWTWANLLFSCEICNHRKGTLFPLARSSTPLAPEQQAPGTEDALLIDPSDAEDDDPRTHIQFRPVGGSWLPFPRNGSLRGEQMITALKLYHPQLGLSRAGLLSQWRMHARDLEQPIEVLRSVFASEARREIQAAWQREVIPRLFSNQAFVALSIDIFDHSFPHQQRERWGLELEPLELPDSAVRI